MKKRIALIGALLLLFAAGAPATDEDPIRFDVTAGPEVTITVPKMSKESLVLLVSEFFAKDNLDAKAKIYRAMSQAKQVTFVITTKP